MSKTQNGTYRVRLAGVSGTYYKLTAHNGRLKIWDVDNGKFIRPVYQQQIGTIYIIEEKLKPEQIKYNLLYKLGTSTQEIKLNSTFACIQWHIDKLSTTTHRLGVFIPVPVS